MRGWCALVSNSRSFTRSVVADDLGPVAALRLYPSRDAVGFRVRAVPGARRTALVGVHGDALRVAVREVAEGGRANAALVVVLAETLGVARAAVRIVSGASSRDKRVVVGGVAPEGVRTRLAAHLSRGETDTGRPKGEFGNDGGGR